jgi:hypothetical protein
MAPFLWPLPRILLWGEKTSRDEIKEGIEATHHIPLNATAVFIYIIEGIHRWAPSPISVISDIRLSLISERPISD